MLAYRPELSDCTATRANGVGTSSLVRARLWGRARSARRPLPRCTPVGAPPIIIRPPVLHTHGSSETPTVPLSRLLKLGSVCSCARFPSG